MDDQGAGLDEGWYLMSTNDLEQELARVRDPSRPLADSTAKRLSIDEAIAYRNAGNLPDEHDRTLRLVLRVDDVSDLGALDAKRRRYEPDYHDPPRWRREGSVKVNVVPLRGAGVHAAAPGPWWENPDMAALEEEWRATGRAAGLAVPGEWRGFVFKTIAALRAAGRTVSPDAVADSAARWLSEEDAGALRAALRAANRDG